MSQSSQRAGFITGGSSGIGLEMARILLRRGQSVALFARDAARLSQAQSDLGSDAVQGARILLCPCDVADRSALEGAVETALAELGPPSHAIAAAGVAVPGLFLDQDVALQDQHMAVNYTGARDFVRAVTPAMSQVRGHIGLVSSAASYFGIYGYSAYAPSKYALRALAEVLTLELAAQGISVTHIAPPDTDTAMLAAEERTKPPATKDITAAGGLWQPQDVAARAIAAMDAGRAEAPIGAQTKALARLSSLLSPALRAWQRRIIRRHDRN